MFVDGKFVDWIPSQWGNFDADRYRHMNRTMNTLFFDGHVEAKPWQWLGDMTTPERERVAFGDGD